MSDEDAAPQDVPRGPSARWLFGGLLGLQLVLALSYAAMCMIPRSHDGLLRFSLKQYFLGEAMFADIPLWFPYFAHGCVANWWLAVQQNLFQSALLTVAGVLPQVEATWYYYLGMVFDEAVLLLGTWLLARRYLRSNLAIAFVATSVLGSTLWMAQPDLDLRLVYAIPLSLALLHRFLDTGHWRWVLVTGNILALQGLGQAPYLYPVLLLILVAYFVGYALGYPDELWARLRRLRPWSPWALGTMALLALTLAGVYELLTHGTETIANFRVGRRPDGTVYPMAFLRYGGPMTLKYWGEAWIGTKVTFDSSVYIGLLNLPLLAVAALLRPGRSERVFLVAAGIMFAFTCATGLSAMLYHVWPLMDFYRHIGQAVSSVRLFLCFLGGLAFEAVFLQGKGGRRTRILVQLCVVAACVTCAVLAWFPDELAGYLRFERFGGGPWVDDMALTRRMILKCLMRTACIGGGMALVLVMVTRAGTRIPGRAMGWLMLFHALDVFSYKDQFHRHAAFVLEGEERLMVRFEPLPYRARRGEAGRGPRSEIFERKFKHEDNYGALYAQQEGWRFQDDPDRTVRINEFMEPVAALMRILRGNPPDSDADPFYAFGFYRRWLPDEGPLFGRLSGYTRDKLRVAPGAVVVPDRARAAAVMLAPGYEGRWPVVTAPDLPPATPSGSPTLPDARVRVRAFSSNRLAAEVTVPAGAGPGAWLVYADSWHPFWTARVDGRPVRVYPADVAYKAVRVPAGTSRVEFVFRSPRVEWLQLLVGLNGLAWVLGVGLTVGRWLLRGPPPEPGFEAAS